MESFIYRNLQKVLEEKLAGGFSFFLFGPRQSGKTTLIKELLRNTPHLHYNLMQARDRLKFESDPTILREEILAANEKVIFIDEIQKVPALLDEIQSLIDEEGRIFILTGSSARKLKRKEINLLPGRTLSFTLLPFSIEETRRILPDLSKTTLKKILKFGELPRVFGLVFNKDEHSAIDLLYSYTETYLEEEIRAEAVVRRVGNFVRFLKIAGELSGKPVSFRALSQDIGVSHVTISEYFKILVDTLIATEIPNCIASSQRSRSTRASKYIFFDTGVVNALAGLLEAYDLPEESWGHLFEQWVGITILKTLYHHNIHGELCYWRSGNKEIDWIIRKQNTIIPFEVKWSEQIRTQTIKLLESFLKEKNINKGFIVYTGYRRRKLSERIFAIPWHELPDLILEK